MPRRAAAVGCYQPALRAALSPKEGSWAVSTTPPQTQQGPKPDAFDPDHSVFNFSSDFHYPN